MTERNRRYDKQRGSSAKRGYGARWQKARAAYLAKHPLCIMCEELGRVTAATVVDHIEPHKGDMAKFWDSGNWAALCARCHNSAKQSFERTGILRGCDADGMPLDPNHRWRDAKG
jgi:5-methylcytosine-specific restriction endonuclease McrA